MAKILSKLQDMQKATKGKNKKKNEKWGKALGNQEGCYDKYDLRGYHRNPTLLFGSSNFPFLFKVKIYQFGHATTCGYLL